MNNLQQLVRDKAFAWPEGIDMICVSKKTGGCCVTSKTRLGQKGKSRQYPKHLVGAQASTEGRTLLVESSIYYSLSEQHWTLHVPPQSTTRPV